METRGQAVGEGAALNLKGKSEMQRQMARHMCMPPAPFLALLGMHMLPVISLFFTLFKEKKVLLL